MAAALPRMGANAARGGLGDLNENALVFVANHVSSVVARFSAEIGRFGYTFERK